MTDHLPSDDRVSEYLIERGWQPPKEGRNHWLGPDGKPTYFWSAVNTSNYQILLDAIAFTEDRSQLNIGLELEGHPPLEVDLRALDHALAVWALLRSDPKALARYADEPSTKLSITAFPPWERELLLAELRDQLDHVAGLLGDPPGAIQASGAEADPVVLAFHETATDSAPSGEPEPPHTPLKHTEGPVR